MNTMTYEELFNCGMNYETYVGTGTREERLRIPKNYSRINLTKKQLESIRGIEKKVKFLCVGEIWCPDCQINLTVISGQRLIFFPIRVVTKAVN